MNQKQIALAGLFFLTLSLHGQSLQKELDNLKKDPALKHASWSLYAVNSKTDSVLADFNSQVSLIPASTLKIVTTSAALGMLGSNFVFKTQVQHDGTFDSTTGILNGNVYIVGGGDPSLESMYFNEKKEDLTSVEKWAAVFKAKGIKKITGAIIGDAGIFEDNAIPPQWIWADIGNYFGAAASGLTYRDNKFSVYFKSGAVGSKTTITSIQPAIDGLQLVNNVAAGGSSDSAYIFGAPYTYYRQAEGTIPPNKSNYEVEASLPDPALFCAQALENALKVAGIPIGKPATTARTLKEAKSYSVTDRKNLHTNVSPPLDKIVYWTNMKSVNLYAEHLLKYISYMKTGSGTEATGIELVLAYWKDRGVDVSGFTMTDGCGLSRANVITTKTEVQILSKMMKDKNFDVFYNSFPVAGKAGSLGNIGKGTFADNNLRAKSGYITGVRGYAGYVKNRKGELVCFSVLANNYECTALEMKKKLERLLIALAESK